MASTTNKVNENVVYVTKEVQVSSPVNKKEEVKEENEVKFSEAIKENIAKQEEKKVEVVEEVKEEPVKEEKVEINEERFIPTEEELLNVLVQATKDSLLSAKQKWVVLPKYMNSPSTAKVTTLLLDGIPVAAAKNMLILAYENETYLNRVNLINDHKEMNNFLKALYNENMMCYCVTKEDFIKLKGKLPAPKKIDFDEEKVNEEKDEGLEFGKKVFGDFLNIKEEQ